MSPSMSMSALPRHGYYRGRVRSGCLTCRGRKVKCDEAKPACDNCTRLERRCVYKPKKSQLRSTNADTTNQHPLRILEDTRINHVSLQPNPSPASEDAGAGEVGVATLAHTSKTWDSSHDPFLHPDSWKAEVTARLERALQGQTQSPSTRSPDNGHADTDLPATLISRDIELTTTMDFLASRGEPSQLITFFADEVECPGITPFDPVNWQRAKLHLVELGKSCPAVASGVIAVSALYKAQLYALSQSKALSHYRAVKRSFDELLQVHSQQDFDTVIAVAFLLCLFELIHAGEVVPVFKEPSTHFVERLAALAAAQSSSPSPATPPLTIRLITWIKIFQAITMRAGGTGLLSETIETLLPEYESPIPTISPLPEAQHDDTSGASSGTGGQLGEVLGAPLFDFYFRLQLVSRDIARLTHYHRSRTTGGDQDQVVEHVERIKARLRALWAGRSTTQRQTPQDLAAQLAPRIARPLASLIGICDAAYHAEFVEIDRVLGDPVSKWTDSRDALRTIRDLVDRDRDQALRQTDGTEGREKQSTVNPGYIRALFLYAIECMDEAQIRWATDRIADIRSSIYRSDFFAKFATALADAQMRKERRVTSKYFCIWFFGVPPPYM
ncbi:hypothetical protein Z517_07459 [Fonsecaea pedrosoi CBS 271.37]|uniref:Zn(2)-C6 fungal-type domain-containing protein n=1 Tax=Fonsecaea pedrosoi CBS 271.37 TaxID=1442368 RepID=A0A0D2ETS3_9EURO|nr:uncharacterized protein Z517_07459 [Fonsecaea pedrosoi CBS 271.37]KIW77627.1 hypothetical protein Z517_07459 [Fonsecaea pedrosoi CBS 271.37]